MKMTNIALLVGFSIVALATPALAAVKDSSGATKGRDAAVAACNAEAQKHYGGMYYNFDQTRDFAYEHCMHDRGVELSPIFGDGLIDQAAAVAG